MPPTSAGAREGSSTVMPPPSAGPIVMLDIQVQSTMVCISPRRNSNGRTLVLGSSQRHLRDRLGCGRLRAVVRRCKTYTGESSGVLSTGRILHECIVNSTPDDVPVLHRFLRHPNDIRMEITMKGALAMFTRIGSDMSEVFSQPRTAQQAALQGMRRGWSLYLTLNDPLTGAPWNLSLPATRDCVRRLVSDTKSFMLIGSPQCMHGIQQLTELWEKQARFKDRSKESGGTKK